MANDRSPVVRNVAIAIVLIAAVAVGWWIGYRLGGGEAAAPTVEESTSAPQTVYADVAGQVVRVAPDQGVVTIDHEEIEGFMAAMVMDFHAADPRELTGLEPGQEVLFDIVLVDGRYMIVRIRPAGEGRTPDGDAPGAGPADAVRNHPDPLDRGDLVPDLVLIDARGRTFRLREMDARRLLITFFYARCPLDNFCPAQSRRLAQLQEQIEGSGKDVHLVSLTLDADHDRPDILASYAERFGVDPQRWTLAGSDDAEAIRAFANRIGARVRQHDDAFQIDHALVAVRVDDDRIVDYVYGLEAMENLIRGM